MGDAGGGSSAFARFVGSSAAALVAETFTLPTDVAKTRLQTDSVGRGLRPAAQDCELSGRGRNLPVHI